ncbi:MAG: hypothetical protein QM765_00505 [Myxococcales bacterium]
MKRAILAVVAGSFAVHMTAARAEKMPLPQQYVERLKAPATDAMQAAAGYLAGAQKDFKDVKATWPWEEKGAQAAPNAAGIVAKSLIAVYVRTSDPTVKAAAEAWGKARLADVSAARMLYDPDIEALAELGKVTGEAAYTKAAKAAFDLRHSGANGREVVERLFMVRKGNDTLVGFDAAHTIRAGIAVGEVGKAREVAQALAETEKRWNLSDKYGFYLTSRAAVLEALVALKANLPLEASLRSQIIASQGKDGTWGQRNTQATAYSTRALFVSGDAKSLEAGKQGLQFLRTTQLKAGGWGTFNDYLPEPFVGESIYEVTAEVLLAVARSS